MKKLFAVMFFVLPFMFTLTSCTSIGSKTMSLSVVYGVTAVLSLVMLAGYCALIKKRESWFFLLLFSVFVVNIGYLAISLSKTTQQALFANRIAYLGSVLLPLAMFMIILGVTGLKRTKAVPVMLFIAAGLVFLVAASPGYLDIYYKSAHLEVINGVSVLVKEYGPWHIIYLFYLLGYFAIMTGTIIHAIVKKKLESCVHAAILLSAVLVNIAVWLIEQLVSIEFEFLSVSYIISEMFLIGLFLLLQHQEKTLAELKDKLELAKKTEKPCSEVILTQQTTEQIRFFAEHIPTLTAAEKTVYGKYLEGKGTKEILAELDITENTLKYHNKNIYGKLGVSSRKQLIEFAKIIEKSGDL